MSIPVFYPSNYPDVAQGVFTNLNACSTCATNRPKWSDEHKCNMAYCHFHKFFFHDVGGGLSQKESLCADWKGGGIK